MPLRDLLLNRFEQSTALYEDFIKELAEPALALKLPGIPSNQIGAQLWCVVCARESYSNAIEAGKWSGFSCSLTAEGAR